VSYILLNHGPRRDLQDYPTAWDEFNGGPPDTDRPPYGSLTYAVVACMAWSNRARIHSGRCIEVPDE